MPKGKMNPETKEKWIAALRSGEYKQTDSFLRAELYDESCESTEEIGFCCLGVLCDVVAPDKWSKHEFIHHQFKGFEKWGQLGPTALKRFKISADEQETLIRMNDGEKRSFSEIADWIDENL